MDYKREAIEILRSYADLKESLRNMNDELRTLNYDLSSLKSHELTGMPIGGGGNYDDRINNLIFKKDIVEKNYRRTSKEIQFVEQILKGLDDTAKGDREEKHGPLLRMWFVEGASLDEMMDEFICSKTELYRLREDAIKRFAKQKFGLPVIMA